MATIVRLSKRILLTLSILSFQSAFSQENFVQGYVINIAGDTLSGYIDYREWTVNPNEVRYKSGMERKAVIYKPSDIIEFGVQNEIYVSATVEMEITSVETNQLRSEAEIYIEEDTIFLRTLIKGEKSLYMHKREMGRENFYIESDAGFEWLIYKRYLSGSKILENKMFLSQLAIYMNACPSIRNKLEYTTYRENSLVNAFQYYHGCTQSDIEFRRKLDRIPVEIGVLGGVSVSFLKFESKYFQYLVHADFRPSMNISGGVFFNVPLPQKQGKWSINNELLFSTYKVQGEYFYYRDADYYSTTTTELGYSYLKMNNLVRFKYPVGSAFLYLNGGVANGYVINETNNSRIDVIFAGRESAFDKLALKDTRKFEHGFILGMGAQFRRISCEARFEWGSGISEYRHLISSTERYYFLLGYRF